MHKCKNVINVTLIGVKVNNYTNMCIFTPICVFFSLTKLCLILGKGELLHQFSDFWKVFRFLEYIGIIFLPVVTNKMPQFMKGSSSFGDFCGNKEFSDVTLACEDGQLVEAHEVILAGPVPKQPSTPLGFSWGIFFRPSCRKKGRVFESSTKKFVEQS